MIANLMFMKLLPEAHKFIIERGQNFDPQYTNVNYLEIADYVKKYHQSISPSVQLYRSSWWFRRVLGTTYTGNIDYIGVNSRNMGRTVFSIVGTIAHEWGHILEYYVKANVNKNIKFNHGDNKRAGKDNTFQYWFGEMMKKKATEYLSGAYLDLNIQGTIYGEPKNPVLDSWN